MSTLSEYFSSLGNKIRNKTGTSTKYTPTEMVSSGIDDVYQAGVSAGTPTQTKTVTAGTSAITVSPDSGYALSSVTVNPTPSESKSITATTSQQTVTPDSGKVLSSVTVNPQNHSGIYIPAANTASNDMGANHNRRYIDTSGMYVPASITPSNSNPASMSSDNAYKPSANGYAISSYTNVTPSSDGTYFPSGIVKMSALGYAYTSRARCRIHTDLSTGVNSYRITGLVSGVHYLLMVFADSSKTLSNTLFDNVDITECILVTNLMNFYSTNSHNSAGTIWDIVPNNSAITVSYTASKFVLKLFMVA